jgi:Flp pilus assembly pilin Flp
VGRTWTRLENALSGLQLHTLDTAQRRALKPQTLRRDQRGQDLIEYALLLGFMVIAVFVILPNDLMPAVSSVFSRVVSSLVVLGGA